MIDVGYSGVIGAERIVHGQAPWGNFPIEDEPESVRARRRRAARSASASRRTAGASRANPQGDTYGPVAYESYIPGYLFFGWNGKWDSLPAAHFTSIAFDLLCMLGLWLVGRRSDDEPQPEHAEDVERDRREMGSGERVPLAVPPEEEIPGEVRLIRDGAVRVPLRVRPTRSRPFVWMRSRISPAASGSTARLQLVPHREVPRRCLPMRDALRADHARVADVDDIRGLHVEADAKAAEEDRSGEQDPGRPDGARRASHARSPRSTTPRRTTQMSAG